MSETKTRINSKGQLERYTPSTPGYRSYAAAKQSRLVTDWAGAGTADKHIRQDIKTLRDRSREAERDDGYVERFLIEMETNIIGPKGIQMASKVPKVRGAGLNTSACEKIEQAWRKFSERGNFDVTRQFSRSEFERLAVRSIARDGQFLPRFVEGFPNNAFRFAVQGFEADALDYTLNDEKKNIRMGIERNEWDEPIAYHLLKADTSSFGYLRTKDYQKVSAESMAHLFITHRINQSCGVPWISPALNRLRHLRGYEEAEVIAARLNANNHTYFERSPEAGEYGGEKNADGTLAVPSEPGTGTILPDGYTVKAPLPGHPNPNYPDFRKAMLRGVAASCFMSYNTLASDLEGVSFSSIRQGTLSDRAIYELLQNWFIEEFEIPAFRKWLRVAILSGEVDLNIADIDNLCKAEFNGRRWSWVDPTKDLAAAEKEIALNINSRQQISRERGKDFSKTVAENAADKELLESNGLGEPEPVVPTVPNV